MVRLCSSLVFATLLLVAEAISAQQVTLLDFSLATCAPCRQMDPVVQRLEADGFAVRRIDGERQPRVAAQFRVERYPTFVVVADGREVTRFVGVRPYAEVRQLLLRVGARPAPRAKAPVVPATFAQPVAAASPAAGPAYQVGSDLGPVPEVTIPGQPAMPAVAAAPLAARPPANPPSPAALPGPDPRRLLQASVRIKVAEGGSNSFGTGTIIDTREGEALVLTCAHLFRDAAGQASSGGVTVELFQATAAGVQVVDRVPGEVISFDQENDVALLSIRPRGQVEAARVAASPLAARVGEPVWSVGCDNGADPSVRSGSVTTTDRYTKPASLTATGAPVVGRSGGGLFNARGELVGVCFGASQPDNEGFYAKLSSIHGELDKLGLSAIYRGGVAPPALAAVAPPAAAAGRSGLVPIAPQSPPPAAAEPPVYRGQTTTPNPLAGITPKEQATLEELTRRVSESEVVCVIRPRQPGGRSEVITLDNVSPEFVRALQAMRGANPTR